MSVLAEKLLARLDEIEKTGRLGPAPIGYVVDDGGCGYCVMPEEVSRVYQSEETERSAVLLLCAALREVVEAFVALHNNPARKRDAALHLQWTVMGMVVRTLTRGYGLEVEQ